MKRKNNAQEYYCLFFILMLIISLLLIGVFAAAFLVQSKEIVLFIVFSSFFVPLPIIFLVFYIHFRNAKLIHIQITRFTSIDFSMLKRNSAALVGTAIVDNQKIEIITTYTFSSTAFSMFCASDYMNRDVMVGYDPKWNKWVVIEED